MASTVTEVARRLVASRLLSSDELREMLASEHSPELDRDTGAFCRELVRMGRLTEYQAREVVAGNETKLVLGKYIVLDELGSGGMGQVFVARHRLMDRLVAIKIVSPNRVDSPGASQRFRREVRVLARLEHPNIVTAYDADEADGTHFLVMQYVEGRDLSTLVQMDGRTSVGVAASFLLQAARGLDYAHRQHVLHRDIKPSNLLVDRDGTVRVLDMGLAAFVETDRPADQPHESLTHSGQIMGTINYMSPEQAEDTRQVDARSDIYSLGCTLFWLLAARPPYPEETLVKKILAHRTAPIPRLADLRDDVPASLDKLFRKMVAKQPQDRQPSMSAVIVDLEEFLALHRVGRTEHEHEHGHIARRSWIRKNSGSWHGPVRERPSNEPPPLAAFEGGGQSTATNEETNKFELDTDRVTRVRPRARGSSGKSWLKVGVVGLVIVITILVVAGLMRPRLRSGDGRAERRFSVPRSDSVVRLRKILDGRTGEMRSAVFSPNGKDLAAAEGEILRIWNLSTGRGGPPLRGHQSHILDIAYSPDGQRLASAGNDGRVGIWDANTEQLVRDIRELEHPVVCVTFSPDGRLLAIGDSAAAIQCWEFPGLKPLSPFRGHIETITALAFSKDANRLISAGMDATIRLWDVPTSRQLAVFTQRTGPINSVAFAMDDETLVTSSGYAEHGQLVYWDISSQQSRVLVDRDQAISAVIAAADGKQIVYAQGDQPVLLDLKTGAEFRVSSRMSGPINSLALAADRKRLAATGSDSVQVWGVPSGASLLTLSGNLGVPTTVACSPVGKMVAAAGTGRFIRLWDAKSGDERSTFQQRHRTDVRCVAYSPDGKSLLSGSDDRTIQIWDASDGTPLRVFEGHEFPVWAVACSPDGRTVVSAGGIDESAELLIWNLETTQVVARPKGHANLITSVAISPDGLTVATASYDDTVKLWNVGDGPCLRTLEGHRNDVTGVVFAPDGKTLATCSRDTSIRWWRVETGEVIRSNGKHDAEVLAICFSRDGRYLFSGGADKVIKVWGSRDGHLVDTVSGRMGIIHALALSADGSTLVSVASDGLVRLWDVDDSAELP